MQFKRGNIGLFFKNDPTLKLWMPFEENSGTTTRDLSGNGNHGTNTNIVYLPTNNILGTGVKFNGTSSKISIPNGTIGISGGEITVSAFINFPPRDFGYRAIIGKLTSTGYFSYLLQEPPSGGAPHYLLPWGSDSTTVGSSIQFAFSTTGSNNLYFSAPIVLTGLHHVACVLKSGMGVFIYVDGKLIDSSTSTTTFSIYNNTSTSLYLGYRQDTGLYWAGLLDEVAIFSRALSLQEISEYYLWSIGTPQRRIFYVPINTSNFFHFFR